MILKESAAKFEGMEIATFKLKEGVTEGDLLSIVKEVEEQFLSRVEGLYGHFVLKGKEGMYADIAMATTQSRAEAICALWLENPITQKYIELLEPEDVDMSFWTKIA